MDLVRSVVLLLLFVSGVTHLVGSKEYKPYVRLVTGCLLLLIVLRFVTQWTHQGVSMDAIYDTRVMEQWEEEYQRMERQLEERKEWDFGEQR